MKTTIAALKEEMIAWRHYIHAYPEIAFEEKTLHYLLLKNCNHLVSPNCTLSLLQLVLSVLLRVIKRGGG